MPKLKSEDLGMLPGTVPVYDISCKDVVMGRGSGTQNHCGNVTYRKLVFLNKVSAPGHFYHGFLSSPMHKYSNY